MGQTDTPIKQSLVALDWLGFQKALGAAQDEMAAFLEDIQDFDKASALHVLRFFISSPRVHRPALVIDRQNFGAFCLAVRTLTCCQLVGFPLNH